MLPHHLQLRETLRAVIAEKEAQGHDVDGLQAEIDALPDSYDAMDEFAHVLAHLPLRPDWPYVEPNRLDEIWEECDPGRPRGAISEVGQEEASMRAETGFLGLVTGCVLGKPLEIGPSLEEIRRAGEYVGEWPISDFISEAFVDQIGRRHRGWAEAVRGRIAFVPVDDDINYPILGMLLLDQHGVAFTKNDVREIWLRNLPLLDCFGPERMTIVKAGMRAVGDRHGLSIDGDDDLFEEWVQVLNPGEELCGALIRIDAYGYACPGWPALAAELAWRDASFTHRRTGVYSAMFLAAALATAFVAHDRLEPFETALGFVPRRSRFHEAVSKSLAIVRESNDWLEAYEQIHALYSAYGHCRVYQEIGTLINTMRFADDVGDGICKQVSQGNDTDSFAARVGSLLGVYLGPGHFDPRWLEPFNDDIRTSLGNFHERSLSAVARRMGALAGSMDHPD